MQERFKDKNHTLFDFLNEIHFICPLCSSKLISKNDKETFNSLLTCTKCSFRDSSENIVNEVIIKANCNNCGEKIRFSEHSSKLKDVVIIRCTNCQSVHKFKAKNSEYKSFEVIMNKYSLWYSESFKGNHFWAYNDEHLEYIESYVKAGLRQRHNRTHVTMVERLPKFVKSAKNRKYLLKLIHNMKQK